MHTDGCREAPCFMVPYQQCISRHFAAVPECQRIEVCEAAEVVNALICQLLVGAVELSQLQERNKQTTYVYRCAICRLPDHATETTSTACMQGPPPLLLITQQQSIWCTASPVSV
eukprot:GHUV01031364.1.p1 GENE.GHUV01031364.1~~GHUV01031364.1.p1  ORF type:complete len:115 (-),score=12.06 GHUV01031364.1:547-891(-)